MNCVVGKTAACVMTAACWWLSLRMTWLPLVVAVLTMTWVSCLSIWLLVVVESSCCCWTSSASRYTPQHARYRHLMNMFPVVAVDTLHFCAFTQQVIYILYAAERPCRVYKGAGFTKSLLHDLCTMSAVESTYTTLIKSLLLFYYYFSLSKAESRLRLNCM